MKSYFWPAVLGLCVLSCVTWGCASSKEGEEKQERRQTRAEPSTPAPADIGLAISSPNVQTIQLYQFTPGTRSIEVGAEEARLPVVRLPGRRGNERIKLEFDLMESTGRPLSVYFYHANLAWRRDMIPGEYMAAFHRGDLFDYEMSRGTQVQYSHFEYVFPNESVDFRISGNYILRVTEQGQEEEVLFERPFFVTENATALQLGVDNVMVGSGFPSAQPVASFRPPEDLLGNVFSYNTCFVQNGLYARTRCSDNPSLMNQPDLLFYLQPEMAFEPQGADYFLDLSTLQVGGQVLRTDYNATPYRVTIQPDYARFPASGHEPLLNGQPAVSSVVRDVGDPDTEGEYVRVLFSYVPPEEEVLSGGVLITGSFNGWTFDLANQLTWVPEEKRYEGEILIKQGQYEYRYTSPDRRLARLLRTNMPRQENLYSAFVYYSDASLTTDRLLATQTVRGR